MEFLTINKAAASLGLPDKSLRKLLELHKLPGFYVGTRFYVNMEMLRERINDECMASIKNDA